MVYKITIEINEEMITSDEIKQTATYLSDTLNRMRIDHAIECHMDKMKLFSKAKNYLSLKQ